MPACKNRGHRLSQSFERSPTHSVGFGFGVTAGAGLAGVFDGFVLAGGLTAVFAAVFAGLGFTAGVDLGGVGVVVPVV